MASIYRNAFITIAATRSENDRSGCYSSRTDYDKDYEVVTEFQKTQPFRVFVRQKIAHFDSPQDSDTSAAFPLLDRGWVYQERLLSPRFLHFATKELIWECREFTGCQCRGFRPNGTIKRDYSTFLRSAAQQQAEKLHRQAEDEARLEDEQAIGGSSRFTMSRQVEKMKEAFHTAVFRTRIRMSGNTELAIGQNVDETSESPPAVILLAKHLLSIQDSMWKLTCVLAQTSNSGTILSVTILVCSCQSQVNIFQLLPALLASFTNSAKS